MFLQKKNEESSTTQESKSTANENPLMQHFLKRKRQKQESQQELPPAKVPRTDHDVKHSLNYHESESRLASLLFNSSMGLIESLNDAPGHLDVHSSGQRKCCWASKLEQDKSLIEHIPADSMQFKALMQYMKKNRLESLHEQHYEQAMRTLFEKQYAAPEWISSLRQKREEQSRSHSAGVLNSARSLSTRPGSDAIHASHSNQLDFSQKVKMNAHAFSGYIQNIDTNPQSNLLSVLSSKHTVQLFQFQHASDDHFPVVDTIHSRASLLSAHFHIDLTHMLLIKQQNRHAYNQNVDLVDLHSGKRSTIRLVPQKRNDESDAYLQTHLFSVYANSASHSDFFAFGDETKHGHIALYGTNSYFPEHTFVSSSPVSALSFSADNRYLFSAHTNAQVKIWDLRQRKPLYVHWDHGATDCTAISCDSSTTNPHYTTGSSNGVLNVYALNQLSNQISSASSASSSIGRPKPIKSIDNLVTPISHVRYNNSPDGSRSVLAFASQEAPTAFRLANPRNSYQVYENFPSGPDYAMKHHIKDIAFSARGDHFFVAYQGFVNMYSM